MLNMFKFNKTIIFILVVLIYSYSYSAPQPNLWAYWDKSNPNSTEVIDFKAWQNFLGKYTTKITIKFM